MATLVSPGVDVSIIDDSFYNSAGAGTVPLFIIATAQNKTAAGGNGTAPGTLASQAGVLYQSTSQRDLVLNYGYPNFLSLNGTPLHGNELNEYGLLAAYSYLGVSNQAYVLRAGIDLNALQAAETAPVGPPVAGTYWLNLTTTSWGVFQSNGNPVSGLAYTNRAVKVATASNIDGSSKPMSAFGNNGDFCVVPETNANLMYEKINGAWYELNNEVGTGTWREQNPLVVSTTANPTLPANGDTLTIVMTNSVTMSNTTSTVTFATPATLTDVANQINAVSANVGVTANAASSVLTLTQVDSQDLTLSGPGATKLNISGTFLGNRVTYTNGAQYPTRTGAGSVWVKLTTPNNGANWGLQYYNGSTAQWVGVTVPWYQFDFSKTDGDATKDAEVLTAYPAPTLGFIYGGFDPYYGVLQLRRWNGTSFAPLVYEASATAPTTSPVAGTLWYSSTLQADIMVNMNGGTWQGYHNRYPNTDPNGIQIAGSAPTTQSDGVTALADNDLWLDASDLENYPMIYRWSTSSKRWTLINNTDSTTPFGIVFADARQDAGPTQYGSHTIAGSTAVGQMVLSNFLDPDAPNPETYPDGMLLFNTRFSTYNVKQWSPDYFLAGNYDPNTDFTVSTYTVGTQTFAALASAARWTTASGNQPDGSPYMGRKAQRIMVVKSMAEAIMQNEDIRSEAIYFNLIAAPGYPELISDMISLNTDIKEVAFIVGDTPARLAPTGTAIQQWATNANNAAVTGEKGLTLSDAYTGLYYPWGLGTNTDGSSVMVPPSMIAMVTLAYNDQVSYPWFAPAGFTRGLVTNAQSVGYLTASNTYQPVVLNQGQRDTLYENNINPIAYIPNRGLVVWGQKTLSSTASALDRINVARLTNYLRYNLDNLVKPFLFEPNDSITRNAAQVTVERFLLSLVGLRALEDFAVLCDGTNNTPDRVDQNQLWIDIIILPTKAIEYIYIPVRIQNSGSGLSFASNTAPTS